ncbi:MAG: Flp pilus assembly protein CpaB [Methylotenera sp.]|nr:Flp pilus assembly protein CpaB [Oligoflexia bacterium]
MNNKALTLSLFIGAFAVFMVQSYVGSKEEEAKKKFGTEVLVVKAKRDIKEQETINETALELALIPKTFLEPASVSFEKTEADKETNRSLKSLSGTIALVAIRKGEQITYNKMTEPGIRTGLSPQVAPGRRAVSIPVNETSGVAKLVKPGDRVDLIAVLDMGGGKENKIAKTIFQDVVVLAVGRNVTNNVARVVEMDGNREKVKPLSEDFSFTSVTLEVEPAQAQTLALVMANGENAITLSLRNNDDTERVGLSSSMAGDVLGTEAARVQRGIATGKR